MKTALYGEHLKLGGRMVEFAGWELPVMYSSILEEHNAVRKKAGIFDVSHMGEIILTGKSAKNFMRSMIPTSMDRLSPHKSMYSCFCNPGGGVIDDLFVYMISDDEFYLVVNASTRTKDFEWLVSHKKPGMDIIDVSDVTSKIDLQGPASAKIAGEIFRGAFDGMKRFDFIYTEYRGRRVLASRSGYTGEFGYEFYIDNDVAVNLWNDLLEAGKKFGIQPAGLGARDTLRLESCYSLYGHEVNDGISPVEGGVGWIINSGDDFVARDILVKQKAGGAPRELICYELIEKGVPREGCRIAKNGTDIGYCTSGGYSPTFKKGIGMALVTTGELKQGDKLSVIIRDNPVPAQVVKRPFYKYTGSVI
jgi:aminomethyltransferase